MEWMVYSELEPFGTVQEDLRAGMIAATIANFFAWAFGKKKRKKPYKAEDFIPDYLADPKQKNKKQTVEEMRSILHEIAGRANNE